MKYDLVLKNAMITTADNSVKGSIAVKAGKIVAIGGADFEGEAEKIVDCGGKPVIPGCIDTHCHIGWPDWDWEEECVSTTQAAAAGGVTTVMLMEGQADHTMQEHCGIRKKQFEDNSYVDGTFHEIVYTNDHISQIVPMATEGGITSFKFFIPYRGSEVVPPQVGIDDGIIYLGFEEIGKLNKPAIALFHPENIEIFFRLKDRFIKECREDIVWNDTRPNISEVETIRRCVAFAKATGCSIYVVHMTVKEAAEEILRARAEGVTIYGETCPQYLALNCKDADPILSKVNPPIRTKEDNEALWKAVADGVISTIGSDHAACAKKHKQEFWSAVVGFAGIQTMLPVILTEGVAKGRISLNQLVACMSTNAAKIFGLYPQKGTIEVGADADLVVLDMDAKQTCHADELYHMSDFTPFEGMEFKGMPVETYVRGELVAKEGKIVGTKGTGKVILSRKATLK